MRASEILVLAAEAPCRRSRRRVGENAGHSKVKRVYPWRSSRLNCGAGREHELARAQPLI
jgi:hypothetical protein